MYEAEFNDYADNYRRILNRSLGLFANRTGFFESYKIHCMKHWIFPGKRFSRILDFGCGDGQLTILIAKELKATSVWGYDPADKMFKSAQKKTGGRKRVRFTDALPEHLHFDLILAVSVFHHIDVQMREVTLLKLKSLLAPGGRIVIFEHNPFNPMTRRIVKCCPMDKDVVLIRSLELTRLAASCGLLVSQRHYILYFPWPSRFLRKLEEYFHHLPLGSQYMMELICP